MAWSTSTRTARLPPNWKQLRARILTRDHHRCTYTAQGERCTNLATDVHHIANSTDHTDTNLVSLCSYHHAEITKQQSAAARWRYKTARTPEAHPGLR